MAGEADEADVRQRGPVAAGVVAGWGAINAVLVAMLAGFAGLSVPLLIYGCATALVGLVALGVFLAGRFSAEPRRPRPHACAVPLLGTAALLGGLGLAFGWWLAPIAAVVLVLAAVSAGAARRSSS